MEVGMQGYSQAKSTEWYNLSFASLLSITWLPIVIGSAVLIALSWLYSNYQILSQNMYAIILFVAYVVLFAGFSITLLRKGNFTRNHVSVVLAFMGFALGFIVAAGKIFILFRGWAFLRLVSEPILTALFASIIGALVFWRKTQLKSRV